jgi:hypothetical protein
MCGAPGVSLGVFTATPQVTPSVESRASSTPSGCQVRRIVSRADTATIIRVASSAPNTTWAPGQSRTPPRSSDLPNAATNPESLLRSEAARSAARSLALAPWATSRSGNSTMASETPARTVSRIRRGPWWETEASSLLSLRERLGRDSNGSQECSSSATVRTSKPYRPPGEKQCAPDWTPHGTRESFGQAHRGLWLRATY